MCLNVAIGERIDTTIAGHWPQNGEACKYRPAIGEVLELHREDHNEYNSNAIKVVSADGMQVSYVKRTLAKRLTPLVDESRVGLTCTSTGASGITICVHAAKSCARSARAARSQQ